MASRGYKFVWPDIVYSQYEIYKSLIRQTEYSASEYLVAQETNVLMEIAASIAEKDLLPGSLPVHP
jgi:hypothetical protein